MILYRLYIGKVLKQIAIRVKTVVSRIISASVLGKFVGVDDEWGSFPPKGQNFCLGLADVKIGRRPSMGYYCS